MEIVTRVNRNQLDSNVAFIIHVYIFLMKLKSHENQTKMPSAVVPLDFKSGRCRR